jgi:hypothetical protein
MTRLRNMTPYHGWRDGVFLLALLGALIVIGALL